MLLYSLDIVVVLQQDNTNKYGSFPNVPAHATYQEDWDGIGWTRGPNSAGICKKKRTPLNKVGSVNSHIVNGDDYPTLVGTAAGM